MSYNMPDMSIRSSADRSL